MRRAGPDPLAQQQSEELRTSSDFPTQTGSAPSASPPSTTTTTDGSTSSPLAKPRTARAKSRLFRNLGPDGFKDVTADVGLDKIQLKDPRAIITGDYDNDGATDLLITQNHGPAVLLRNEGGNKNNWLKLKSERPRTTTSVPSAPRSKFSPAPTGRNLKSTDRPATSARTRLNSTSASAKRSRPTSSACCGRPVSCRTKLKSPRNKVQNLPKSTAAAVPAQRYLSGMAHYELVGDMIGAGVVGHWVAPGERNIARPTEYIKVDRRIRCREETASYSFRLMEPMEEVVYLDQVGLLAVDHPAGVRCLSQRMFRQQSAVSAVQGSHEQQRASASRCVGRSRTRLAARSARPQICRRF